MKLKQPLEHIHYILKKSFIDHMYNAVVNHIRITENNHNAYEWYSIYKPLPEALLDKQNSIAPNIVLWMVGHRRTGFPLEWETYLKTNYNFYYAPVRNSEWLKEVIDYKPHEPEPTFMDKLKKVFHNRK